MNFSNTIFSLYKFQIMQTEPLTMEQKSTAYDQWLFENQNPNKDEFAILTLARRLARLAALNDGLTCLIIKTRILRIQLECLKKINGRLNKIAAA